jgi:hypothetical protein
LIQSLTANKSVNIAMTEANCATVVPGHSQKHQAKLAELHFVAVDQHRRFRRFPVDVGPLRLPTSTMQNRPSPTATPRAGGWGGVRNPV